MLRFIRLRYTKSKPFRNEKSYEKSYPRYDKATHLKSSEKSPSSESSESPEPNPSLLVSNIIRQAQKRRENVKTSIHFDPSNAKLDLTLPNKELYGKIAAEVEQRTLLRYKKPSEEWKKAFLRIGNGKTAAAISNSIKEATFRPNTANDAISVGDLVTLNDTFAMYLVVDVPRTLGGSYRFVSDQGTVVFGTKRSIQLRFPGVVPDIYSDILSSFVCDEKKHEGMEPIGVVKKDMKGPSLSMVLLPSESFLSSAPKDVSTVHVPISARQIYSDALGEISKTAARTMNSASRALQKVHSQLQGDPMAAPPTVSLFDLLERVYGKSNGYKVAQVVALVAALRKNVRLYSIDRHRAASTPATVTVVPTVDSQRIWSVVSWLKNGNAEHVANYLLGKTDKEPKYYAQTISLLRDYVVGNFSADYPAETQLVSVIRMVEKRRVDKDDFVHPSFSYEFSRARAYYLLSKIGASTSPVFWSRAKKLPRGNTSPLSEISREYYEYIDRFGPGADFVAHDRMEPIREPFEHPVYCIDSPDAHEIDDGISIHPDGEFYVVTVHVANPSSYIDPNSTLAGFAQHKGNTTYLPEEAVFMFPQTVSKLAGLGEENARTFAVEFRVRRDVLDKQAAEGEDIYKQIAATAQVKSYLVSNFPQGYTYSRVNEVLGDKKKNEAFLRTGTSGDVHFDNLYKLHKLSQLLQKSRVKSGGIIFHVPKASIKVNTNESMFSSSELRTIENGYEMDVKNTPYTISIKNNVAQDQDSKSQLLVSEAMVAANHAASLVALENKVAVVYRAQNMKLHPSVSKEIAAMMGSRLNEDQLGSILSALTAAKMQAVPECHQSIGVSSYINVTSPLRRYADMVNHWKLEDMMLEKAGIKVESVPDSRVKSIAEHLQNSATVDQWASQFSNKFWESVFMREVASLDDKIPFRLTLGGNGRGSTVSVRVWGFDNLRGAIGVDDVKRRGLEVGDVFGDVEVERVDFAEDEIIFKSSLSEAK